MNQKIVLSSGNIFIFLAGDNESLPMAYVYRPKDFSFVGGFLGDEAIRKNQVFSKLGKVEDFKDFKSLRDLNLTEFGKMVSKKSNLAYGLFKDHFFRVVKDSEDAEQGRACQSRRFYYAAMHMIDAYSQGKDKSYLLGMMIANHISNMSWEKFYDSFHNGASVEPRYEKKVLKTYEIDYDDFMSYQAPLGYFLNLVSN